MNLTTLPLDIDAILLADNMLSGNVDLSALPPRLVHLDLSRNALTGRIDVATLPRGLKVLSLFGANFEVELECAALPRGLERLELGYNDVTGTLAWEALPPKLYHLALVGARVVGEVHAAAVPRTFGYLALTDCGLPGTLNASELPAGLRELHLTGNRLTGTLALPALPRGMTVMYMGSSRMTGELDLRDLPPNITGLNLSWNAFTGVIGGDTLPRWLHGLDMSGNGMRGSVTLVFSAPNSWAALSDNALCGQISLSGATCFLDAACGPRLSPNGDCGFALCAPCVLSPPPQVPMPSAVAQLPAVLPAASLPLPLPGAWVEVAHPAPSRTAPPLAADEPLGAPAVVEGPAAAPRPWSQPAGVEAVSNAAGGGGSNTVTIAALSAGLCVAAVAVGMGIAAWRMLRASRARMVPAAGIACVAEAELWPPVGVAAASVAGSSVATKSEAAVVIETNASTVGWAGTQPTSSFVACESADVGVVRRIGLRRVKELSAWNLSAQGRTLGRGATASVVLVGLRGAPEVAAAMKITRCCGTSAEQLRAAVVEGKLLVSFAHPHIVGCYGVYRTRRGDVYCALEVAPYLLGEVVSVVKGREDGPQMVVELARQLLGALAYVHGRGYVHCDVKPQNVLVGGDGQVRLADFGAVVESSEGRLPSDGRVLSLRGTPIYYSPEMLSEGVQYTFATDVWAAGLTVESAWTGMDPYFETDGPLQSMLQCYWAVVGPMGRGETHHRVADDVAEEVAAVVRACCVMDAQVRATAEELAAMLPAQAGCQAR